MIVTGIALPFNSVMLVDVEIVMGFSVPPCDAQPKGAVPSNDTVTSTNSRPLLTRTNRLPSPLPPVVNLVTVKIPADKVAANLVGSSEVAVIGGGVPIKPAGSVWLTNADADTPQPIGPSALGATVGAPI